MKKMNYFVIVLFVFMIVSCDKFWTVSEDDFSIERTNYNGNELRIDGYYYLEVDDSYLIHVFFGNGVLYIHGYSSLEKYESSITDFNDKSDFKWGLFLINDSSLIIEQLRPNYYGQVFTRTGEILNDTTFFTKEIGLNNEPVEAVFHFKKFAKPDSTNNIFH